MTTGRTTTGRVAVVTGAARGIGAAVVGALAAEGWSVVAVDACADDPAVGYPLARPEELAAVCAATGAVAVQADVRDREALAAAVALAEQRFGGLDAAVAAAGVIGGGTPLWETPDPVRDAVWDVDLGGVWNLAAAAVPALLRRPEPRAGRFVAIASAAAHRGLLHLAAYCAAKHAVVGLVRGLAHDLRGTGVTATAVSPGSTGTPILAASAALYGLDDPAALAASHLVDRVLDPAEVAETVRWLCGPGSSAVTGTVLHADGGFTA